MVNTTPNYAVMTFNVIEIFSLSMLLLVLYPDNNLHDDNMLYNKMFKW